MTTPVTTPSSRPVSLTFDRAAGALRVEWADGHAGEYALRWLRANCPCAGCREERRAARAGDGLRLFTQLPSAELAGAELVGSYAVQLAWQDGHNTGIYPFTALRAACPCAGCSPAGPPPLIKEFDEEV